MVVASPPVSVDLSGLLCSLFPDVVKAAMVKQAKRLAEEVGVGPPLAERPQLIEDAKQRHHTLEVEEEVLISQAEAGLDGFFRRHDVNPAIVLIREEAGHA